MLRKLKITWNGFQTPCPVLSTCSILWLTVNALGGKWMWSWLFTARVRVTVGVIMIKNKKCQQLIWYTATWLSDWLTYNPTGVTLPCSLLAKCQRPTWLLSYTVWYPQATLRDSTEVQRFTITFSASLKPYVQCCTPVWTRWGWGRVTPLCFSLEDRPYISTFGLSGTETQFLSYPIIFRSERELFIFFFPLDSFGCCENNNSICMQ